jgi:hypothetical protein
MAELISAIGLVSAAAVTGIFSLIAHNLRRENTKQHAEALTKLDSIIEKVNTMSEWQNDHQSFHETQGDSP